MEVLLKAQNYTEVIGMNIIEPWKVAKSGLAALLFLFFVSTVLSLLLSLNEGQLNNTIIIPIVKMSNEMLIQ